MLDKNTLPGITYTLNTANEGNVLVVVNLVPTGDSIQGVPVTKPWEVLIIGDHAGPASKGYMEAVGRLISIALQNGVSEEEICKQLAGIHGNQGPNGHGGFFWSVPDAIAQIFRGTLVSRKRGPDWPGEAE
jgi:hypothetical protein